MDIATNAENAHLIVLDNGDIRLIDIIPMLGTFALDAALESALWLNGSTRPKLCQPTIQVSISGVKTDTL